MVIKFRNKIWKKKKPPYQVGKDDFTVTDLKDMEDEWIDPKMYLPLPYDLVFLKTVGKIIAGWWTGHIWDGLNLKKREKILFWKFNREKM